MTAIMAIFIHARECEKSKGFGELWGIVWDMHEFDGKHQLLDHKDWSWNR